ncbi:DUF775-domain-containing protein [Pholiota conissans]|uniref:DUF775-domain-containing protein n=1 Tax=Pholiota conissans TaxID=109636 RepID=A0A9P5YWN0_9AGAR|nr:DUF775-domain-containing protein [Pholiota conissans]
MFGCCVAGRPLQTNMIQVDDTHAYFELFSASTINHICVFLLGDVLFPEGYGATVHFLWPGKGSQLLGYISNDKPSAMFRVKSTFADNENSAAYNKFSVYSTPPTMQNVTAILGLSVEPMPQIQEQMQALAALQPYTSDLLKNPAILSERIVKHLINYISGFTGGAALNSNMMIPVSLIERWYETFTRKLQAGGVGFLERGE